MIHLSLQEIMSGPVEKELYIGHDAQHMRGVLTLNHPIKNGIICNWEEMEKVRKCRKLAHDGDLLTQSETLRMNMLFLFPQVTFVCNVFLLS